MRAVDELLLQELPALTRFVKKYEARILEIALAKSPDVKRRVAAVEALTALQSDAVPRLVDLLLERSTPLVAAAAKALGGCVRAPKAVTTLLARLDAKGDWPPQLEAVCALRYFDDARVAPALIAALKHPQAAVTREALAGLGELRAPEGLPALVAALRSSNPQHVTTAAQALRRFDSSEARAALDDAAAYEHVLQLAKSPVGGHYAVAALGCFSVARAEQDLLDHLLHGRSVQAHEAAVHALAARGAQWALAPLARRAVREDAPSLRARSLVELLLQLAQQRAPDATEVSALVRELEQAPSEVLDSMAEDSDQLRFDLRGATGARARNLTAWRSALGRAKAQRRRISRLLDSRR